MMVSVTGSPRIDWRAERDRLDLASLVTRLLGPAPGRRGERGRRLWWSCPLHVDHNPSLCVDPGKAWWRCYGCGERGDAATLIMKLRGVNFPEAVACLTGDPALWGKSKARPKVFPQSEPQPSGISHADALALVEAATARLWTPEGAAALAYLTGPERGLTPSTIRAARLGVTPPLDLPGRPCGIVVPWFRGQNPTLIKIRQPAGHRPKYYEAFRERDLHTGIYSGVEAIRPGRPLIVVEGEFDSMLLGQALGELAAVVTMGSASARPEPAALGRMLAAAPWYIATDSDPAGDRAATGWPASARRVRPPGSFKDWTAAASSPAGTLGCGMNLRRWWSEILAGNPAPEMFSWEDLAGWRWGQAGGDTGPGIDARGLADPIALAERLATTALDP